MIILTEKQCRICKTVKPIEEYHRCGKHRASYCKPCQSGFTSEWRILNRVTVKEKSRERFQGLTPIKKWSIHLKQRYGMTPEDYERMVREQNGTCKICGKAETIRRRLSVDHCHSSKRVRGLLCNKCNNLLGRAEDDVTLLYRAVKYLLEN